MHAVLLLYLEQEKMKTLYEPSFEHDACGIGAVVNIDGSKSHKIVDNALSIVEKLEHRAGKDASGETGDGVGILVQISHDFYKKAVANLVGSLGEREYGIGQFFFPAGGADAEKARFEKCCAAEGLKLLGWREVPVNADVLGKKARDCMPSIWQPVPSASSRSAPLPGLSPSTPRPAYGTSCCTLPSSSSAVRCC